MPGWTKTISPARRITTTRIERRCGRSRRTVVATRRIPHLLVLGLAGVVLGNQQRLRHLFTPFYSDYAEVRTGLAYISRHQRLGEPVFLNADIAPIERYYLKSHAPPLRLFGVMQPPVPADLARALPYSLADALTQLRAQGTKRVWLLYDRRDASYSTLAASQGRILTRYDFERGHVLLLQFR